VLTIHAESATVGGQLKNLNVILEKSGQHDFFIRASYDCCTMEATAPQCRKA